MRRIYQAGLVPDGMTSPKVALLYRAAIVIGREMTPATAHGVAQVCAPMNRKQAAEWKRTAWRKCVKYLRNRNSELSE